MPLFEYQCLECKKRSEELILAGDAPSDPSCPSCGSAKMHRLLSTFAAHSAGPKHAGSKGLGEGGFDPATACGGGPCATPDMCGMGMGGEGFGDDGGYGGDDGGELDAGDF